MSFYKRTAVFVLIFSLIAANFSISSERASAIAYSFTQTSWTGGTTADTATHTSDQTGWTELSASSGVTAGATVTLPSTDYTFTDDGATSTSPTAATLGGDFDNGTNSDTTVSGSDTGASVALTGTLTTVNAWDDPLAVVPGTIGAGSSMIRDGSSNDIYVLQGGGTGFYKYSISGNSWTTLAVVPGAVGAGAFMIRNGSDNDIYVMRGTGQTSFYKYSISGDSWATLAVTPAAIGAGSMMIRNSSDNDIYLSQGGSGTGFYRYSISGDSWATLTVSPTAFGTGSGASMIRNGSDNEIYLTQGGAGGGTGFWRYSISGNSWTTLTGYPFTRGNGASTIWNGTEDYFYGTLGNGGTSFYRYSIVGTTWTARAVVPGDVGSGGSMIRNGSDNEIYLVRGNSSTGFYRYSISGNSWTTMNSVPATLTTGSSMIRNGSDGEIYVSRGGGTGFYRFVIEDTLYPASGTFTSAVIDTAAVSNFGTMSYGAGTTLPTGTAVTFDVRAGNTATPDGTWTAYTTGIASGGSLNTFDGYRYIQYKINLTTTDDTVTPSVDEVDITYSQYTTSGTLTSSKFNSTFVGNVLNSLTWLGNATSSTETIKFQVRSSDDGTTWSNWCGFDDCSGSTYFTYSDGDNGAELDDAHPLLSDNDDQYLQYQVTLASAGYATPALTAIELDYGEFVAPIFSSVTPTSSSVLENATDDSDLAFTTDEALESATITFTRTSGNADAGSPHTCTLTGTALNVGAHTIDLSDTTNSCTTDTSDLVSGAVYTLVLAGSDAAENAATSVTRTEVTFGAPAASEEVSAPRKKRDVKHSIYTVFDFIFSPVTNSFSSQGTSTPQTPTQEPEVDLPIITSENSGALKVDEITGSVPIASSASATAHSSSKSSIFAKIGGLFTNAFSFLGNIGSFFLNKIF